MTDLRSSASAILSASRAIRLPAAYARLNGKRERIMFASTFHYAAAHVRSRFVLVSTPFRRIAVGLAGIGTASGQRGTDIRAIFRDWEVDAIAIDLRGVPAEQLRDAVLSGAPREWFYCGILQRAQAERERLAALGELDQGPKSDWMEDAAA